jgi:hypothetical protein
MVLPSASSLPMAEFGDHRSIPAGFDLYEVAAVLEAFRDTHEFLFVTPDGASPQLDVESLGRRAQPRATSSKAPFGTARRDAGLSAFYDRRAAAVWALLEHLGRLPISPAVATTDHEARLIRDDLVSAFDNVIERPVLSFRTLLELDEDPSAKFNLSDVEFAHLPGGSAALVDFPDSTELGELLHRLHDGRVLISLSGNGTAALAAARFRLNAAGWVMNITSHPLREVEVVTVPPWVEQEEMAARHLNSSDPVVRYRFSPAQILTKKSGQPVRASVHWVSPTVGWDAVAMVLTGQGGILIDDHVRKLTDLVKSRQ